MSLHPLEPAAVPGPVLALLRALREAGHECYFVGGAVRDAIRGVPGGDWDIATAARPDEVSAIALRVVPTGIKHGTVTVLTDAGPCQVTTFRSEHGYSDGRHPDRVVFTGDLEGDLARRDFTVNAIAWDPLTGHEVDPFGGRADLAAGLIRAVGDPRERFEEDGLRPIRAARFAATLEFAVEPRTLAAIPGSRPVVARVSAERVQQELMRMLSAPRPSRGFDVLQSTGLLELVLPELARCVAVPQNRYHAYDVYEHTLRTVDAAPAEKPIVRLAALFHDVGKPETRAVREDGEATFYNHQHAGARITQEALTRLRFSSDVRERVTHLVRQHMFDYRSQWTDAAVRRFIRAVGPEHIADLFDLRIADNVGSGTKSGFPHYLGELTDRIARILEAAEALTVRDLAVSGEDIMRELSLPPGPRVGEILNRLLEEVLDCPSLNERERLLGRVRQGFSVDSAGERG